MRYIYYYNDETCKVPGYSEDDEEWLTAAKANPAQLAFYMNGATYYVPARTDKSAKTLVYTSESYKYYFTNDSYSSNLTFRKNGTLYYCGNLYKELYTNGIPAGTYSPSAFESYIKKYISINSYRTVKSAFSVRVNNQVVTVAAGKCIYYMNNASSGTSNISRAVNFYGSYLPAGSCFEVGVSSKADGFLNHKVYIVSSKINYFSNYANYNITLLDDITFI